MASSHATHSPRAVGHVKDRTVFAERWFKAPPSKVFAAWSDPAVLPKFFWPVGTGKVDHLDFKVGGQLRMSHATQPWTAIWTFLEIVPDKRIVTRDIWPDGSGLEATGTLEFIPEDGGTRLKVKHGPFPTQGPYQPEGALSGFSMVMDRLAEETEVPGPGEGFRLVRCFKASPKKVWDMWTTKEGLQKWFGAEGFFVTVQELDVRVGGRFRHELKTKDFTVYNHGQYTEVKPHTRLAWRWDFDIFLGPAEKPYPVPISVDFEELDAAMGGGTRMTFTEGPLATAEYTEGSRQGVMAGFANMAKALGE